MHALKMLKHYIIPHVTFMPTRSTIRTCIYFPMSPLSLVEAQLNIREIDWNECPIGSVMSINPT
jgi:hypothetical protein